MANVTGLVAAACRPSASSICGSVSPPPGMPSTCFTCPAAMRMPAAVMKPEITGWDRKLARKPRRSTPISVSMPPDSSASTPAAASWSAGPPCAAAWPIAEAVISDTTATGPTASVRLVPNRA